MGASVENASYGLSICAERVAICNALSNGAKEIIAIAVFSRGGDASPCGACRQFIREFGKGIVVIFEIDGVLSSQLIDQLIPISFPKKKGHSIGKRKPRATSKGSLQYN